MRRLVLLSWLAVCGCGKALPGTIPAEPPTTAPSAPPVDAQADKPCRTCAQLALGYTEAWSTPEGTCTTPADCSCLYDDLVSACGQRVADLKRGKKLQPLLDEFHARKCPNRSSLCDPAWCSPRCEKGRCMESTLQDAPTAPEDAQEKRLEWERRVRLEP